MRMRKFALFSAIVAAVAFAAAPGFAASDPPNKDAGEESQDVQEATDWFMAQRLAPNGAVDPNATARPTAPSTRTRRPARLRTAQFEKTALEPFPKLAADR